MKTTVAIFRLGVILLVLLGMMSPLVTSGAGAQTVTCEDFSTREEAQEALEEDPNTAAALDEDGDEIACETLPTSGELADDDRVSLEDVQLPGGDDDPTEKVTDEATEEPTEDATEAPTSEATEEATRDDSGGDVDDYLATIQDEADSLQESVDRFIEIDEIAAAGDATDAELEDLAEEVNEIAAIWADYPDAAAEITATAPDGVEEIDAAYQDLAETTGQAGEEWAVYWDTPSGSAEEEEALDAFNETFITMQDQLGELNLLLGNDPDDATATPEVTPEVTIEATPEATPEESDETSGDGEAYIATIQDEVEFLQTSLDDFTAAIDTARDDASSDTEYDEAVDEFNAIAEAWSEYPEVAAGIEAPDGFAEIDEAYQDLAIEVGEMGDNWMLFWEADRDSPEEAEAEEAFTENFDNVQDGIDDLNALLDAMAGGDEATVEATEEPTEDATEEPAGDATAEPSGDVDVYLAAVRDHSDELSASIDSLNEIVAAGEFTDEEITEFLEILELWTEAPDVAAEIDAPIAFSEIADAYLELAQELATAAESFAEFSQAEPDSPESRSAFQDFQDAVASAETLAEDLDDLLTAEGI